MRDDDHPSAASIAALSPVAPGDVVAGKYRVERMLGVGGMGVVVRARHTTLDHVVAIKLLVVNRFATHEEAVARFLAEARAAAAIESDFVCRVFDVGTLDGPQGTPFMVMEHLEGHDLEEEIQRRGPLDLALAADYVLEAADGLAAAHALGIVHRDIKPPNLFLARRPDGSNRMKVLDFGISKVDTGAERAGPLQFPRREATSLGTPAYMAPEQVRAEPDVDARADIWGLGAILYELITGHMAFVGKDVQAILDHVLTENPCPMSALRRDVPRELEQIVMRCLDRNRHARWPSAALFARALAPFGSSGVFAQLASVQRELGSSTSMRASSMPSVQPMVTPARVSYATLPDLEESLDASMPEQAADVRARESIVEKWTKLRARKRTARSALLALLSVTLIGASVAILLRANGERRSANIAAAAPAPPPAVESSPIVVVSLPSAGWATAPPSTSARGDGDSGRPEGVAPLQDNSVHSAQVAPPPAPAAPAEADPPHFD